MNLKTFKGPFPHVIIYDYFTEYELKKIWKELDFLTDESKMMSPAQTGSATSADGNLMKKNTALFLDEIYAPQKNISDILKFGRKLYDNQEVRNIIGNSCWELKSWKDNISHFNTLLSYYENSDYYEPHYDYGYYTVLIHLFKEPKQFSGGELYLPEFDFTLENVCNRLFIFPSQLDHQVRPISMSGERFSGNGRYTITHFCHSK